MSKAIGLVILAAGRGVRLGIGTPKPLVEVMGRKLIDYPLHCLGEFLQSLGTPGHIGIVVGHESEAVSQYARAKTDAPILFAYQKDQKGTADALKTYLSLPEARSVDDLLVMCVDTPLIEAHHIRSLYETFQKNAYDAILASFKADPPTGYGRVVKDRSGIRIIEEKDAEKQIKDIREVNSGLYFIKRDYAVAHLGGIGNKNRSGEYYLTDIFDFDRNVGTMEFADGSIFQGINTMGQLHDVEAILRRKKIDHLMKHGVRFLDARSAFIDEDVVIEAGAVIHPNVTIQGSSHIMSESIIETGCVVKQSTIGKGSLIKAGSYLDQAHIGAGATIGPFAHLRPETLVEDRCRIGNFVEIKKSQVREGAKISHLSYVGDANIGERTNIGCGFITCNYDGKNKHKTTIGSDSFIGSDTQVVAPVSIGKGCYVASGSTITQDLQDGDFAIARSRQTTKEGVARRFLNSEKNHERTPLS